MHFSEGKGTRAGVIEGRNFSLGPPPSCLAYARVRYAEKTPTGLGLPPALTFYRDALLCSSACRQKALSLARHKRGAYITFEGNCR